MFQPLSFEEREELINQIADGKYFRTQHPHGQLCLTAAAWAGSTEIIKTLVTHGADMALKNLDGRIGYTILMIICKEKRGKLFIKSLKSAAS